MCPTDKREIPSNVEGLMPCDALLVLLLADEGSDEKAGQGGVNLTDGSVVTRSGDRDAVIIVLDGHGIIAGTD